MRAACVWFGAAFLCGACLSASAEGPGLGEWKTRKVQPATSDERMEALTRQMEALDAHRCDPNPFSPNSLESRLKSIECRLERIETKLAR
jgi:hypothetical protein